MVSGTIEFRKNQYTSGDTIVFDASWSDAVWNFTGDTYGSWALYNPNNVMRKSGDINSGKSGSLTVSRTATGIGTWTAILKIWDGSEFVSFTATTDVVEETPGDPVVPPPGTPTYRITITTNVSGALCKLIDTNGATAYSGTTTDSLMLVFPSVYRGGYDLVVSKSGYTTYRRNSLFISGDRTYDITLEIIFVGPPPPPPDEPPPEDEPPNLLTDPIGWLIYYVVMLFEESLGFIAGTLFTNLKLTYDFVSGLSQEVAKFMIDPIQYIKGVFDTFLKNIEQEEATTTLDQRNDTRSHWKQGSEWIAGQYKTIDDLTNAEFQALVDKGLTDDKNALRASDFRIYKLDASSKATFEATMEAMRTHVGGLWLAVDTQTELLLEWDSEQFAYMANFVEEIETSWVDKVWDVVEGGISFVTGGFLDFNSWSSNLILDFEGYTDSKIIDVKEWFDINIPGVIEAMFGGIFNEGGLFGQLVGFIKIITDLLTGKRPKEPEIIEFEESQKEIQEKIDNIFAGGT